MITAQSCAIAALSGSTDESFDDIVKGMGGKQPQGSNSAGKSCITKYYKELGIKAPSSLNSKRSAFMISDDRIAQRSNELKSENSVHERDMSNMRIRTRQACKPNVLLFARGTTEPGTMGSTVGPALSRALGSKWRVDGVRYTADIAGDNCIGFPGGVKCVDQLAKIAQSCPDSNFFLSGYSQGAMVARICVAFSKDDVKRKVKVNIPMRCIKSVYRI
jgi:Cutinase